MKMEFSIKLLKTTGFSVLFFPAAIALAQNPAPRTEVVLEPGEISYKSVPEDELGGAVFSNMGPVMGLTSAKFKVEYGAQLGRETDSEGCLPVESLKITAGYSGFDILIDERYQPGSCEYEAIALHEREHVAIYRSELEYYGKLIEDELLISSLNMGEVCVEDGSRGAFREKAKSLLRDDERISLLFARLDESVKEKNEAFDTEEEYLQVKSKCSAW